MRIERNLDDNIGMNNKRVYPDKMPKQMTAPNPYEIPEPTATEKLAEISKSIKAEMNEKKFHDLTRDPENSTGHKILLEKYGMSQPNAFKYGRAQGGISNVELDKLGIGQVRPNKVYQPKRILPKNFRDDPFADPPPITESDIKDGMFSLLNRGIIPRDVDLTPAFERGKAPLTFNQAQMTAKEPGVAPQLSKKVQPGPVKYLRRRKEGDDELPDPNMIPDAGLHRDNVFLTSMNVEDHEILRQNTNPTVGGAKSDKEFSYNM